MTKNYCNHRWVYKRTRHEKTKVIGSRDIVYKLIDEYFCDKCLAQKEITTHAETRDFYSEKPSWFN